ncbi:extracellular matrix regulator RemB [Tepidibacter mesophilus]|uniref:extracellular matrix regulator RemB n=1 Tax=Tepidibacter mesophilus TaxID=655607 RepID=UPI000C0820A0|nr:extracellular matrix/biofilm biosynthesis regulator RemA family protein [Tepidibacter mesophilus]
MFLHLGGDCDILISDIIFILDSKCSYDFKKSSKGIYEIINLTEQNPKSIIVTDCNNKFYVYYSPISSITLLKRAGASNPAFLETEVI